MIKAITQSTPASPSAAGEAPGLGRGQAPASGAARGGAGKTLAAGSSIAAAVLAASGLLAAPSGADGAELRLGKNFTAAQAGDLPRDLAGGFQAEERRYPAHHATEWQVRLRAPAGGEPPLFEEVKSADFVASFPVAGPVALHWNKGSHDTPADFEPRTDMLTVEKPIRLESFGGRSSDGVLPYFNLAAPGGGLILAVGWTGDWKASFTALGGGRVKVEAGLQRSRFRLPPGREVRLPSVLAMPYQGDWLDGQNQFRRLMLEGFTPRSHPPLELMPVAASVHGLIGFNDTTASNLVALADVLRAARLPLDTFWLDAGWNVGGFPAGQGNPEADAARFPQGLAPVGGAAAGMGLRFLAWFEPERVMRGTWLERERAPWLLAPSGAPPTLRYQENDGFRLLDLGHTQARQWAVEEVSRQVRAAGIGIYRQDCNLYPACFWRTGEAEDRAGLREIGHITGLYAFLDELARRHPGLILDNCASGGRRLDFEMMRRCVALWRSDSCWGTPAYPRNAQAMTHGLSLWLPLHGLGAAATDTPALRSGLGACASFAINFRDPAAVEALRRHLQRYLKIRPLFTGDYYPLTPWSLDPARLLAFQFHDPAGDAGLVQAFQDPPEPDRIIPLPLRGLQPGARYAVTDWDAPGQTNVFDGSELLARGLPVAGRRGQPARVFEYAPLPAGQRPAN